MDKQRYNLLYKPVIKPERQYRSEAKFVEEPDRVIPIVPGITPDDPVEGLRELEELVPGLPAGLEFIGEIVTPLRRRAEVVQIEQQLLQNISESDKIKNPVVGNPSPGTIVLPGETIRPGIIGTSEPTETDRISNPGFGTLTQTPDTTSGVESSIVLPGSITTVSGETAAPADLPSIFPPVSPITIAVETPKTLVQIAQEGYAKDQIDLQKYYLQKMRLALQRYFQHQFAFMAELGLSEIDMLTQDYDGNAVSGISANDQHLHDTIIRSQIQRNQKARYFKKLANIEQTLTHMRNWNAAEKLRERYYSEAYGDSAQFVDSEANAVLRQNRSEYDAGYKASLYNMYKYLNSSVTMTEDILDHVLLEAKSKAKLIKSGVDIFAQTQVASGDAVLEALATDNKTNNTEQQQQTSAQPTAEDIDAAIGITDPADEAVWGLAPNGAHFSQADIDYLINLNPEYYGTSGTKAEHVKVELGLNIKYMGSSDNGDSNNQSTSTQSNQVDTQSADKVNGVTLDPNIIAMTTTEQTGLTGQGTIPLNTNSSHDSTVVVSPSQSSAPVMSGTPNKEAPVTTATQPERTTITETEDHMSNGYLVSVTYTAYPVASAHVTGISRYYDVYATARVIDPETSKILFICSSKKGKPTRSLTDMKRQYSDAVEQAILDDVYGYLTVDRWNK